MSIGYQFSPVPQKVKELIYRAPLKGSEFKVLDGVANEVYLFPDTRETLQKELSYRYLAKKLGLHFASIGKILKRLVHKGYLAIVKIGERKEGSIIKVLIDNIENIVFSCPATTKEKSNHKANKKTPVAHEATNSSCPCATKEDFLVAHEATKQETYTKKQQKHDMYDNVSSINSSIKETVTTIIPFIDKKSIPINFIEDTSKQQEKTSFNFTMGGGWFNNTVNNNTLRKQADKGEASSLGSILASIPLPQVKEQPQQPVNIPQNTSPAVTAPAPALPDSNDLISAGVQKKAIYIGMNELKKRNIPDIPGTIRALGAILKSKKNIQNPSGYFVKLCKEVSVETLFKPIPASTCEHSVCVVPSVEKTRRAVNEFWKEEKTAIPAEEVLRTLTKTCPDKLYTVITDVNNDKKIQKGLSFMMEGEAKKIALENIILTEFKKAYPEIVI